MVDVANGVSRVRSNGTSLQNYANADRMATLVDQTLLKGVKPSQISVLVYYTGQLTLVTHKILMKAQDNGRSWDFSEGNLVSSVDSFQGEENEFVFIDIVTAHQEHHDVKRTAHVKSGNRLCCALSRGKSCVVLFCQVGTLFSTVKSNGNKESAAIGAMAKDFHDRKLVYHDHTSLDTSPIGEETRAKWDKARLDNEIEHKKVENLATLMSQLRRISKARITKEFEDNRPRVYRTDRRRTTRPNMTSDAAKDADTHDLVSKRNQSAFIK